jgi:predicted amidohydrolase YtcJ
MLLTGCEGQTPERAQADFVLINARVVTMDSSDTVAEAIAIAGNRIAAIGTTDEISGLAGPGTETIDLDGNTVTPGIIDTHNHYAWAASSNLAQLELEYPAVTSIDDVREQLRRVVSEEPVGEWIFGWRWDAAKLDEQRDITAADLDNLSPEHPVWLGHNSGHYGVANSRAMQLAGIDETTPDPEGGVILRDEDGSPTGIFTDQAMDLPTEHALDLMVRLQRDYDSGYPEVQPAFMWWIGDIYAANFGPERSLRVLPLRTFEERGIKWAGSSDYDVSPYAPRHALWAASAREPMLGTYGTNPWGTDESVSVHDTLRAYTATASRQVFLEDDIGTLEVGKLADIVAWDRDLYAIPAEELKEVHAILTFMNGKVVHHSGGISL